MKRILSFYIILLFSLPLFSQNTFTPLGGIEGGNIFDVQVDPQGRLYAMNRSAGNVIYSDDSGNSWNDLISTVFTNAYGATVSGTKLYVYTYDQLFLSEDRGITWTTLLSSGPGSFLNPNELIISPADPDILAVNGGCEGIFVSNDDGITWTFISTEAGCVNATGAGQLTFAPNGDLYWTDQNNGIYRHAQPSDGIWNSTKTELVFPKIFAGYDDKLSVGVSKQTGKVFITHSDIAGAFQMKYSDTGNSGTFSSLSAPFAVAYPSWHNDNQGKLWVGSPDAGGELWKLENETTPLWVEKVHPIVFEYKTGDYINDMLWLSDQEVIVAHEAYGLFKSVDSGVNWFSLNNGIHNARIMDIEILSNGNIIAKKEGNVAGIWSSTNQGSTFAYTEITSFVSNYEQAFTKAPDGSVILNGSNLVFRSTNGLNWTQVFNEGFHQVALMSDNNLYGIRDYAVWQKSTDNGQTWSEQAVTGLPSSYFAFNYADLNGDLFVLLTNSSNSINELWKVETSTPTWTASKLILPVTGDFGYGGFFSLNNKLYISDNAEKIYVSSNGGITWSDFSFPHQRIFPIEQEGGGVGIGNWSTLIVTQDDGNSYTSYGSGGGDAIPKKIVFDAGNSAIMATLGGAVAKYSENIVLNVNDLPSEIQSNWTSLPGENIFQWQGSLAFNGNDIYTAAAGESTNGVYKSMDGGNSFSKVLNDVQRIYTAPDGQLIAIGPNIRILNENGITWQTADPGLGYITHICSPDGIKYYATTVDDNANKYRIIVSSGDLLSWTEIQVTNLPTPSEANLDGIAVDQNDNIFVRMFNNTEGRFFIYRIKFGEAEKLSIFQNSGYPYFSNGEIIIPFGSTTPSVVKSSDGGSTWNQYPVPDNGEIFVASNGYYFLNQNYDPNDPSKPVYTWVSKNGGSTWQKFDRAHPSNDLFDIEINQANGKAYAISMNNNVNTGDYIYESTNIIIENDNTSPTPLILSPTNNSVNVPNNFSLSITFDEPVIIEGTGGTVFRLFEADNPVSPVETFGPSEIAFSEGNKMLTVSPSTTINYLEQYFVIIDANRIKDIHDNFYAGISNNSNWAFTTQPVPDEQGPIVTFNSVNLIKGTALEFTVPVTDDQVINTNNPKIWHRGIAETGSFQSTPLVVSSSTGEDNVTFSVSVSENWYDEMGMEFYFEIQDQVGNVTRAPSEDPDDFYYSYIDYSNVKPKLERIGVGPNVSDYRIVAVPFKLTDPQISTQLDEVSVNDPDVVRILGYSGGNSYNEFPGKLKTFGLGEAYWMLFRNNISVELETAQTPEYNKSNFLKINLRSGWNLVGNPYPVPISWENVMEQNPNVKPIKTYVNGTYSNDTELQPFEGGFVWSEGSVSNLVVRFKGVTTGGRIGSVGSDFKAEHWEVPITITQGKLSSRVGGIGMSSESSTGSDRYDDYNPPSIGNSLQLEFSSDGTLPFAKSVVNKQGEYTWNFTSVAENNGEVVLSWDNEDFGDNMYNLYLVDQESLKIIDMRRENSYTYWGQTEKAFSIYFGTKYPTELSLYNTGLGTPWPNPIIDKVSIPFAVSNDYGLSKVHLSLYSSAGKLTRELILKDFQPGLYELERSREQLEAQSGLYLLKMDVTGSNGQSYSKTRRILLK